MKKTYTKPDIAFERFSLCSSIASCAVKIEGALGGTCGVEMDDVFIFTEGVMGCHLAVPDDGSNGVCYDVPFGNNNLFNS